MDIKNREDSKNKTEQNYSLYGLHGIQIIVTPMSVDYVVIGFDMEVQQLVTHNAA